MRINILLLLPVLAVLVASSGCSDDSMETPVDDAGPGDIDDGGTNPTNVALVFEVDPISTPDPVQVDLGWIADDADGFLTSAEDEAGVRKLKAFTCLDEGDTNTVPFYGEQRICTLRQLANKSENGDFIYEDYALDAQCEPALDNVHAEVNIYYHAQKIYSFITSPDVGVFDRLPGRHFLGDVPVSLNLVANYRYPASVTEDALRPADVAFFIPHESMVLGMAMFQGLPGLLGDVLVFGQGMQTDFAYAGEIVYHEFGHAVTHATAAPAMIFVDAQGLSNQPRALDEGLANTFGFLGSDESALGEYVGQCYSGGGAWFHAANSDVFPDDLTGHPVADGNAVLGANWEVYRRMIDEWGGSREQFTRVLLLTLMNLEDPTGAYTFADYAHSFLSTLGTEGDADQVDEAAAIFEARGLFEELRIVDITGCQVGDGRRIFMGSAADEPWNTLITIADAEGNSLVSTAYFQCRVDIAEPGASLSVSASLLESPASMIAPGDWDYRIFLRVAAPIEYEYGEGGVATVAHDEVLEPMIEPAEDDGADRATWTATDLVEGSYYLHFVNYGQSEGILGSIAVQTF